MGVPTVAGTATAVDAIAYTYSRKTVIAAGREWVFFGDGTNGVFVSRVIDPLGAWSVKTTFAASAHPGFEFTVWGDGTKAHVTWSISSGQPQLYKSGVLNSDGTITWGDTYTVAAAVPARFCRYPGICLDSSGYPVVAYCRNDNTASFYYRVLLKIATDVLGSAWGAETEILASGLGNCTNAIVLSLPSQQLLVLGITRGAALVNYISSRFYNGAVWSAPQEVCDSLGGVCSAVVLSSGVVLIVYYDNDTDKIYSRTWTEDLWSAAVEVSDGIGCALAVSDDVAYVVYRGSPDTANFYYRKYDGSWGAEELSAPIASITNYYYQGSTYEVAGDRFGAIWSGAGNNVWYSPLDLPAPAPTPSLIGLNPALMELI